MLNYIVFKIKITWKKIPTAEDFIQDHHKISHFYDDKTNNMVCLANPMQKTNGTIQHIF
jgi:hypothetical protein